MIVTVFLLQLLSNFTPLAGVTVGGLYPRESESREVKSLDGIWDFRLAPQNDPDQGFREQWFNQLLKMTGDTIQMPVPGSYNDVTQSQEMRDHIGWAWYDRTFYIPSRWKEENTKLHLRVGSAHYFSIVYINGLLVTSHEFGHLPFTADVTEFVQSGQPNLITICINNTLTPSTIPQGEIVYKHDLKRYPEGYVIQTYDFDFFNYAGIHRPVFLYTTPTTFIKGIKTNTGLSSSGGWVTYDVSVQKRSPAATISCSIDVLDRNNSIVSTGSTCSGKIDLENVHLWWPYLMSDDPGYMYTLLVSVEDSSGLKDVYPQKVGIRSLGWNSTTFTLNNVPLYFQGCGKHEDSNIIGKGVSYATIIKDFSLLKWLGANSFRTSHYPYAEEIMDVADEQGIMVIDESPAANLKGFSEDLLLKHKAIMEEMVARDGNRPSVVMWSVSNEAESTQEAAFDYYRNLTEYVKELDPHRPVTAALNHELSSDLLSPSLDILMLNRYFSWYGDTGHLELIQRQTVTELTEWHAAHNKPVMMSEYGAGTIPGLHMDPAFTWSEEYQMQLLGENFQAFDELRRMGFFIGEMIWNFADFATVQGTTRVGGNKKGIFTRDRQPKMAAHVLRQRYHELVNKTLPTKSKFLSKFSSRNEL